MTSHLEVQRSLIGLTETELRELRDRSRKVDENESDTDIVDPLSEAYSSLSKRPETGVPVKVKPDSSPAV